MKLNKIDLGRGGTVIKSQKKRKVRETKHQRKEKTNWEGENETGMLRGNEAKKRSLEIKKLGGGGRRSKTVRERNGDKRKGGLNKTGTRR